MRILVTGAGGFAGGHMARRLAEAGHHVFALTRSSPVESPTSDAAARFEVVTAALDHPGTLPSDIDAIVHTAATSIWHGISVDSMIADNVVATRALINHALDVDARAFIFFSSISAFGRVTASELDEAVPTTDPDAYGATKLLGEQHLADIAARLPSLAIRLPAVIGRGSKRNWPSEVLRKLRAGEDLAFFNPQTPFNNVVHEADLAALVGSALGMDLVGHDMVVVGSGGQTTSGAVVDLLVAETGSTSRIATREEARHSFLIKCDRARQRYGFEPMPVEEAVRRFARQT